MKQSGAGDFSAARDSGPADFPFKSWVLFLFVFQNYYSPISPFFTLAVNVALFLMLSLYNGRMKMHYDRTVVTFTFLILLWAMIVMMLRLNVEAQVLLKYWRVAAATLLIMAVCSQLRITAAQLLSALAAVFSIHILSIGAQKIFPQLDVPMAVLFGFTRETTIITGYSLRKMGCSSSYDTASMVSIASMLFFYLRYTAENKAAYLLMVILSFLASTMSSRVGMVLGILVFMGLSVSLFFKLGGGKRWIIVLFGLGGIVFAYNFILPVLAYSIDLSTDGYGNSLIASDDYGSSGTLDALTGTHLAPLKAPMIDLLIGFGADPNTVSGGETDIGYVKLIYQIGILGLLLILLLYLYALVRAIIIKRQSGPSSEFTLSCFLIFYILLLFVINYKSLEMYSRGSHELLLIVFFVLMNKYGSAYFPNAAGTKPVRDLSWGGG